MLNFWGPKKDKKVINSSTKCLISVKIAVMTPHIIPLPLVNVWLIFDLQKYVNWLCVFLKVNPFFQKAQVFCMDLQPAADPYNVVCRFYRDLSHSKSFETSERLRLFLHFYNSYTNLIWYTQLSMVPMPIGLKCLFTSLLLHENRETNARNKCKTTCICHFEVANPPGLILKKSGKNMKIYRTKMLSGFLK